MTDRYPEAKPVRTVLSRAGGSPNILAWRVVALETQVEALKAKLEDKQAKIVELTCLIQETRRYGGV